MADCFWFPPLTTEVDGWFDTPSRQSVKLQLTEMKKLPSLLSLKTSVLNLKYILWAEVRGIKCLKRNEAHIGQIQVNVHF